MIPLMAQPNVFSPLPADADAPPGYQASGLNLTQALGGRDLIVKVNEIAPGNRLCPYHYEYVEEWLLVLSGPVQVRTPDGILDLGDGDAMCFPAGPDGAHQVRSPAGSGRPARVLMFSADADPAVCVYPDSDKLAVFTHSGEDEVFVRRADASSHLDYFDGELPPTDSAGAVGAGGSPEG
jgi:uncharacterized cupin superfamily protein